MTRHSPNMARRVAWLALAAAFLFPFYWMVNSSLKGPEAAVERPPRFLPTAAETTAVPARALPAVLVRPPGQAPFEAVLLGAFEGNRGQSCVRVVRDGEVTADTRVVKDDTIEPTGRETAFGGFNSAVAVLAEGERVAVLGQADAPQGGTSYFWTAVSALDRPWRVGLRHETGLRLLRRLQPRWRNYVDAFARLPFAVFFRNSFLICALCTVGQLLSASLAAYAFARLRFPGRDFLFLVLLATLMLPAEVTLIPMFLGYKTLGWVDSFLPIVAPQFCAGAFNVFLLRQFLRTLPRELDEAAMLDGAGCFTIYWRVLMPLARPALIVVGVFTFVWFWKDLMGPLIYLDSMDKRTVALGLESFRNPHEANSHLMMAASALSILPVAALFFLTQRHLLKGIALTGINR